MQRCRETNALFAYFLRGRPIRHFIGLRISKKKKKSPRKNKGNHESFNRKVWTLDTQLVRLHSGTGSLIGPQLLLSLFWPFLPIQWISYQSNPSSFQQPAANACYFITIKIMRDAARTMRLNQRQAERHRINQAVVTDWFA